MMQLSYCMHFLLVQAYYADESKFWDSLLNTLSEVLEFFSSDLPGDPVVKNPSANAGDMG